MIALCYFSYESSIGKDPEKEKVKPHFSQTIMFVEDYLNLVSQDGSFADREQNKLTYEVMEFYAPTRNFPLYGGLGVQCSSFITNFIITWI